MFNDIGMEKQEIILSVIIISHEQREQLRRCVDSVLEMHLPFAFELILSDDRSKDGTYELAQAYVNRLNELQKENRNLIRIVATQCNSDECNPNDTSQRSGYNRCNGYQYAIGKYVAHADGDDFFRPGATVYVREVEALESHPECAIAMGSCLMVEDGKPLSEARRFHFPRKMIDGEVITAEQYINEALYVYNPTMIQRRNPEVDPAMLYGKRYVDYVTTFHHLQFGSIVYVDVCDYVYVAYPKSIAHTMETQNNDREIMWNMGLYIPILIPKWTRLMYMGSYYEQIRKNLRMAKSGYQLQSKCYESVRELHVWLYDCFARPLTWIDKLRLVLTDDWMKMMKISGWHSRFFVRVLNILLTK